MPQNVLLTMTDTGAPCEPVAWPFWLLAYGLSLAPTALLGLPQQAPIAQLLPCPA